MIRLIGWLIFGGIVYAIGGAPLLGFLVIVALLVLILAAVA